MNYGHSWLREKIQLNTDTKETHHGVCITALRKNITNQCCIDITRKADKEEEGKINLKGEGTITPAKSQGSETCVVGGRKPQKERKAETNATKSIMVFLKKAYQMVTVQGSNMHAKKDCINP